MSNIHAYVGSRAFSQTQARELLGAISRSTLYRLIQTDKIRPVKIGGRLVIPVAEIERLVCDGTQ